ncbi:hypothetical protein [Formosa sp. 4Alg 33]|uniref:hypothetical protein n=1 Tax=Formosa sp. 4Alg 33 TaxID=3382189 RepID=UPI003D9C5DC0
MKSIKITKDFLEELKGHRGFGWDFDNDLFSKDECFDEIVPKKLCHYNLITTHSIDTSILRYYGEGVFGYDYFLEKPDNLEVLEAWDIYNNKVDPFPFKIFGAYHNRGAFCEGISAILNHKGRTNVDGKYDLNNLNDLKPCFELYAKGFKKGYEDFEDKFITPYLFKYSDKEDYLIKVFEYVTSGGDFRLNWTQHISFISAIGDYKNKVGAFEAGKYEGRFYRAWSIIFSQNILFAPLFKNYMNKNDNNFENDRGIKKADFLEKRNNLIPDVSISDVYNFFSVLVEKPNRKGVYYLSEDKLLIFIKSTFVDKEPILQSFDVPFSRDKKDVRSVFRKFQDYCYKYEYNKTNVNTKYFGIMNKSFKGFSEISDYKKWHETNNAIPIKQL